LLLQKVVLGRCMYKAVFTGKRESEIVARYKDRNTEVSFEFLHSNIRIAEFEVGSSRGDTNINMPNDSSTKQRKQKSAKAKSTTASEASYDFCTETVEKDILAPTDEAPAGLSKRKRSPSPSPNNSENESDSERVIPNPNEQNEMKSILNSFGADVSKTLSAKRKRLAGFTSTAMKTSNKRYDEIFLQQQAQREKIIGEYGRQVSDVFHQWDSDMSKSKEADEKVEGIIRQLQKSLQQQRVVQNQRLLSLKNLHEQFLKTSRELSEIHKEQQTNIHGELRKELANLQKKMIDDARQEEMANVRKSLQTMLAQV